MSKLKLLIAEDDRFSQKLYELGVSKELFEMQIANNGQEAWEIFNSNLKPDILVLDILMPIMSGYELLKKIRQQEPSAKKEDREKDNKPTVVIMATALGSKNDIMDCLKLGINGYVIKPIKHKEINQKIFEYYCKVYTD